MRRKETLVEEKQYLFMPFEVKVEDVTDEGFFKGYGSTFGGPPDDGGDVVQKGAFLDTIKKGGRNGNGIALLWSHNPSTPVGTWTNLQEDSKGLYVEGIVEPEAMPNGVPLLKLMKRGGIKGLSIGYTALEEKWNDNKTVRTLVKCDLWEISLVTFPMNTRATVTNVKSVEAIMNALVTAKTIREFEDSLRDAGCSREKAKDFIAKWRELNLRDAGEEKPKVETVIEMPAEDFSSLLSELKRVNEELRVKK